MEEIRYFRLKNTGGFVARIQVVYGGNEGTDDKGNIIKFEDGIWESSDYRDICALGERTVDLKDTNIPQGAEVKLKAFVCGGDDKISGSFIYRENSNVMKSFTISGTTKDTTLT